MYELVSKICPHCKRKTLHEHGNLIDDESKKIIKEIWDCIACWKRTEKDIESDSKST